MSAFRFVKRPRVDDYAIRYGVMTATGFEPLGTVVRYRGERKWHAFRKFAVVDDGRTYPTREAAGRALAKATLR